MKSVVFAVLAAMVLSACSVQSLPDPSMAACAVQVPGVGTKMVNQGYDCGEPVKASAGVSN